MRELRPIKPFKVHMLKEVKLDADKKNPLVTTLCGITKPPPTSKAQGLHATVWRQDVTCPICRRMPGQTHALPDMAADDTVGVG